MNGIHGLQWRLDEFRHIKVSYEITLWYFYIAIFIKRTIVTFASNQIHCSQIELKLRIMECIEYNTDVCHAAATAAYHIRLKNMHFKYISSFAQWMHSSWIQTLIHQWFAFICWLIVSLLIFDSLYLLPPFLPLFLCTSCYIFPPHFFLPSVSFSLFSAFSYFLLQIFL